MEDAILEIPTRDRDEDRRAKALNDSEDPKQATCRTDILEPSRHIPRSARDAPKLTLSSTDKDEPTRATPQTEKDAPMRAIDLRDKDDPR